MRGSPYTARTACDYHTSGAWIALACAAIGARYLGMSSGQPVTHWALPNITDRAAKICAASTTPRWSRTDQAGARWRGCRRPYLARGGFTGAPAVTAESADIADLWGDLGQTWRVMEQYWKPYPVCRWAQPPVEAVLSLIRAHSLRSTDVAQIEIVTFHESLRLATRTPTTTEEAQYSTAFPAAVAAVRGHIGAADITETALCRPRNTPPCRRHGRY